jgi:hypothetical protein
MSVITEKKIDQDNDSKQTEVENTKVSDTTTKEVLQHQSSLNQDENQSKLKKPKVHDLVVNDNKNLDNERLISIEFIDVSNPDNESINNTRFDNAFQHLYYEIAKQAHNDARNRTDKKLNINATAKINIQLDDALSPDFTANNIHLEFDYSCTPA